MSVLFSDAVVSWIPVAVVSASLLGSTHCVGMCGGIAVSISKNKSNAAFYHLGRLSGYLWLGILAGTLGASTLGSEKLAWISWLSAALLAVAFVQMGINVWRGKGSHLFSLPSAWQRALHEVAGGNPFSVGAFSALLPCGWLHSFVLAAIATQNPFKGMILLFFFWLGTVPALSFSPWFVRKIFQPLARRVPKMTAILLILAGIMSLGVRAAPLVRKTDGHPDTHHQTHIAQPPSEPSSCH